MLQKILFRIDGGRIPEMGTGHIVRCLLLANKLAEEDINLLFVMKKDENGIEKVKKAGYRVYQISPDDSGEGLTQAIREFQPEIVVIDNLSNTTEYMKKIKDSGVILITFDDLGEGQKYADITINALLGRGDTIYKNAEYIIIPEEKISKKLINERCKKILLSFGGYDHLNLTLKTMKALEIVDRNIEICVIIGWSYKWKSELENFLRVAKRKYKILYDVKHFSKLLRNANIAIISGGLTLYQAMALGTPSIVICQYEHQFETAKRYGDQEALINLGLGNRIAKKRIQNGIQRLITNQKLRQLLSTNSQRLIDGKGLERVAHLIRVVEERKWDTNFFSLKIARLYPYRINEDLVNYVIQKCKEEGIDCLYYLSDCHDMISVNMAEKYGFHFVDIRLTFDIDLEKTGIEKERKNNRILIRPHKKGDIANLKDIASKSYPYSRYYFDQNFSRGSCGKFYTNWIEKLCRGSADRVFVAEVDNKIGGYITCNVIGMNKGKIDLVGVADFCQGLGVGTRLVKSALNWFKNEGINHIEIVTQGRNYAAQRLYQKCGFQTCRTELWYHKWFK